MKIGLTRGVILALAAVSTNVNALRFSIPDALVKEYNCMVLNLHHEARGESNVGMAAVANVVINRTRSPEFPSTICGVVYEKAQFSWVGNIRPVNPDKATDKARLIAYEAVINNTLKDNTLGALYFHTKTVSPTWDFSKLKRTVRLGRHIFYKDAKRAYEKREKTRQVM